MEGIDLLKEAHEDGYFTINNREYHIDRLTHHNRRKVFAYFSSIQSQLADANFSFIDSKEYQDIEKVIEKHILFDDMLLDKLPGHWDEYPEDYLEFVGMSLSVISYPFLKGAISS